VKKPFLRRVLNRVLHSLARTLPGAEGLRLRLHRLRGVKIGNGVFIADEVYLENEYPEAVEIHDGAQISLRAVIFAHTRGPGKVIIGKNAYLGPNTVVVTSGGKTLTIGEGAVIGAGVVVTNDVAPQMFVPPPTAQPVARALVPLATAETLEEFVRGLAPLKTRKPNAANGGSIHTSKPVRQNLENAG
jgi:UDP-3-O-[3-hydroxymyristoyl] glucosamine N-acyltransferase